MPDFAPAPGSTTTSAPRPIIFFTVSGTAATRGSPASVSAATATFMMPPTAANRPPPAASRPPRRKSAGVRQTRVNSGQKIRHADKKDHDNRQHDFHQSDEAMVGLLVGRIIVARCGRVLDFTVVGHRIPPNPAPSARDLA